MLIVNLPHPVRIPWDPDFGEGDEFGASGAGFVDEVNGLADAAFEIEPSRLRSDLCTFSEGIVVRWIWEGAYGCGFVLSENHCSS